MKYFYTTIAIAFLFISCGGNDTNKSLDTILESGDLKEIKSKREEVATKQKELVEQLQLIDHKIAELQPNKKIPLTTIITVKETAFNHYIELQGKELNEEIKHLQGMKTIDMAISYISQWPMAGKPQEDSESTYYERRGLDSSELNIHKSIDDNFNLLRVVDNKRYPAFFYRGNKKYIIKIYEEQDV